MQIVNVYNRTISQGAIGIQNGRIVTTNASPDMQALTLIDCEGMIAIPGFIDTHIHIDSTLLTPGGLAPIILSHGTTTLFADTMEIANVAGLAGIQALFSGSEALPYHIFLEIPSRVPTAPGLETSGGELDLTAVEQLLSWPAAISLGELDPSKIIGLKKEYFAKIDAAHKSGKIANGHAIGLHGFELDGYACAGLVDDHECISF